MEQAPRADMPSFAKKIGLEYKTYGGSVPMMRLYGVTQEGHSVVAHIHGYEPYFYVQVRVLFGFLHLQRPVAVTR